MSVYGMSVFFFTPHDHNITQHTFYPSIMAARPASTQRTMTDLMRSLEDEDVFNFYETKRMLRAVNKELNTNETTTHTIAGEDEDMNIQYNFRPEDLPRLKVIFSQQIQELENNIVQSQLQASGIVHDLSFVEPNDVLREYIRVYKALQLYICRLFAMQGSTVRMNVVMKYYERKMTPLLRAHFNDPQLNFDSVKDHLPTI